MKVYNFGGKDKHLDPPDIPDEDSDNEGRILIMGMNRSCGCVACETFFSKYSCNYPEECDCPECQNMHKFRCKICRGVFLFGDGSEEDDVCSDCYHESELYERD